VLKEHKLVSTTGKLLQDPNLHPIPASFEGVCYLGVQCAVLREAEENYLIWRHEPERIEDWSALSLKTGEKYSARRIARIVGFQCGIAA
jgi:hypothetical protein